ncbi:AAA family ATPase [Sphingobacterium oryzagri]|uniref:AAA family ATPase n=1 Tax=Sphingobacterium oryzagri TaxID=3025669 RepID=A0ABY7WGH0_9SPHI|nr:AAA family ATPase [Sphingobacterium sp. KACC 22765]WDF68701.1 AAA family ATPase [Sphingobacterium sp. KACC 22765]
MSLTLLTAHYLVNHAYLNYQGQLINFGGKYLYNIESSEQDIVLSRNINPSFQDGFFDLSEIKVSLSNVSAIVGQNGVGKSSILNSIRQHFIENPNALPSCDSILFFEDGEELLYSTSDNDVNVFLKDGDHLVQLKGIMKGSIQSIYYSPHFDLRFNPNFDEVDYHDISLDRYIDIDLIDVPYRDTNERGLDYPIKQELLFKNSTRQIRFLSSPLVAKKNIFEGLIGFPDHGNAKFVTRGVINKEEPRNVPIDFLHPLKHLNVQIEKDLDRWTSIRKFDNKNRILNQIEINRFLLQRYMVRDLLSIIIRQMDAKNDNRSSGSFDHNHYDKNHGSDSLQGLIAFIESCKIPTREGMVVPFDVKLIKKLFNKVYHVIDGINREGDVTESTFKAAPEDAIAILELQNSVMFNLSNYYNQQVAEKSQDYSNLNYLVVPFLFYFPAERNLSSGENAMLNFFSKLYDFLTLKLDPKVNPKNRVSSYLLLLDEADLGFHPLWKKKYLFILTKTLAYFFKQYPKLKNIQLIFTTHDPLTLSDLPNNNVIYLRTDDGNLRVLNHLDRRPTFAANITDLLADSFFIDTGLVGDFVQHKIDELIEWLNGNNKDEAEKHKQLIEMIDEPIVRQKLAEMYDEKMNEDLEISLIEKQLLELNQKKEKLINDRNLNK